MKSITGPDLAVLTGLASIHLVNLSTMTNRYFFLMASPFKGSHHIKPPDRKGPSDGDCLESGRWHMALVCEKLATDATLNEVLCVCPGCRPIKTYTEGLAYKGPSCGVVAAKSSMNFCQKLSSFLFGGAPLKYSGSAFLVEFSLMNLVGLRAPHNAARLILILREFSPIKVGQEGFGPWGNDCHDEMGRRCNFGG